MAQSESQKLWYFRNKEKVIAKIKLHRELYGRQLSEKEKLSGRLRYYKNKKHNQRLHQEWVNNNKARIKELGFKSNLKVNFNMTVDQYNEMLQVQEGVCYICKKEDPKYNLSVDHNHTTGEIRGLLCRSCNLKLGWMEKYQNNIIKYLKI